MMIDSTNKYYVIVQSSYSGREKYFVGRARIGTSQKIAIIAQAMSEYDAGDIVVSLNALIHNTPEAETGLVANVAPAPTHAVPKRASGLKSV